MDPKKKKTKAQPTGAEPIEPQDQHTHAERDDYLEGDALDAHAHGEQPESDRQPDLIGTAPHGGN